MFVKSIKGQRFGLQPEKWKHQVNRHSPVVSLSMKTPNPSQCYNCVMLFADHVSCFFMVIVTRDGGVHLSYSLEESHGPGKFTREEGTFVGFDSVSVVFGGLRFHWSRESEKVVVSDALAGRRDFDSLTIE